MTSYIVRVAIDGIMKYEYPFDTYLEALHRFAELSRETGTHAKDVRVVAYDDETKEECEFAHKEVKPL